MSMNTPSTAPAANAVADVEPPPLGFLLLEGRAAGELAFSYLTRPLLRSGPRGDGHPIMVLPGFLASGASTQLLRSFLTEGGWSPHSWKQGRNLGLRDELEERIHDRLVLLSERYERKVSVVGWSLGGVFAREMARRAPERVRQLITMGSPFALPHKANHSWRLFNALSDVTVDEASRERAVRMQEPPPVPTTAIYSRSDGVAAWQCCVERFGPQSENIEVQGAHCGLGHNPLVLHAIADRLAQPEGRWQHFRRSGKRRFFYGRPRYPRG
jgi:pimeloyl-ACP methyl ester carboxylesterase